MKCPRCHAELRLDELLRMASEMLGEADTGLVQSRPMEPEASHDESA